MNYYREGEREKEAERDGELLRVQLSAARRYLKIFLYVFLKFLHKNTILFSFIIMIIIILQLSSVAFTLIFPLAKHSEPLRQLPQETQILKTIYTFPVLQKTCNVKPFFLLSKLQNKFRILHHMLMSHEWIQTIQRMSA